MKALEGAFLEVDFVPSEVVEDGVDARDDAARVVESAVLFHVEVALGFGVALFFVFIAL